MILSSLERYSVHFSRSISDMASDNVAAGLYASAAILLFFATVTTALRCYARIVLVKAFGPDDYLMLVTLVSSLLCPRGFSIEIKSFRLSTLSTAPGFSMGRISMEDVIL